MFQFRTHVKILILRVLLAPELIILTLLLKLQKTPSRFSTRGHKCQEYQMYPLKMPRVEKIDVFFTVLENLQPKTVYIYIINFNII